ncbi:hypothetical protein MIND_01284100 [Mycena indigotica]|uniref:Uncharacterized protein n=1 Tax=Mycena indigotica TaxID=2126181 RepID=A0A8H6S156_9AGAR|nr:uncharacterized protein MIND_01284100 [Mycena indigotica]KAF7291395.1 hypothetical protein MIND_01284100 [Mycena indigotica]
MLRASVTVPPSFVPLCASTTMGDAEVIAELERLRIEIDAAKADARAIGYALDSFSAHPLKAIEGPQAQMDDQAALQTEHYELQGRLDHSCSAADVLVRLEELREWEKRLTIEQEVWGEVLPLVMASRKATQAEETRPKKTKSTPTRGKAGAPSAQPRTPRRDSPAQQPNSSRHLHPPAASETSAEGAVTPQTPRKAKKATPIPLVNGCVVPSKALQPVVKSSPPGQHEVHRELPRPPASTPKRIAPAQVPPPIEVAIPAKHFAVLDHNVAGQNAEEAAPARRDMPPRAIEMNTILADALPQTPDAHTNAVVASAPVASVSPLRNLRFRKIRPATTEPAAPSPAPGDLNPKTASASLASRYLQVGKIRPATAEPAALDAVLPNLNLKPAKTRSATAESVIPSFSPANLNPQSAPAAPVSAWRSELGETRPATSESITPNRAAANLNPKPNGRWEEGQLYQWVDGKLKKVFLPVVGEPRRGDDRASYLERKSVLSRPEVWEKGYNGRLIRKRPGTPVIETGARPVRRCRPAADNVVPNEPDSEPVQPQREWDYNPVFQRQLDVLRTKVMPSAATRRQDDRYRDEPGTPPVSGSLLDRIAPRVEARPAREGERAAKRARRGSSSLEPGEIEEINGVGRVDSGRRRSVIPVSRSRLRARDVARKLAKDQVFGEIRALEINANHSRYH